MDVSIDDVSSVLRVVREVLERWDDPQSWREHLLKGACQLLNGKVGSIMANYNAEKGWFGNLAIISIVGLPKAASDSYRSFVGQQGQRHYADVVESNPGMELVFDDMRRQGWSTRAGSLGPEPARTAPSSLVKAHEDLVKLHEETDCDACVVSVRVVDIPRRPEAITIERQLGAAPFGDREVTLLKLLHDEIAPLVGVRLATEEHISRDGLSKRLRETLALLLEGQSEKQIATALGLGMRTIHDYVMRLYKHFQVSSRAELLAYFIRRRPAPRGLAAEA